ncbi:MAG: DEAD/DEAH box helicase [Candidatus Lokiarchaeota archaeon]|nr:DEAD/DEAH box helicase [Candidatus Lokiarchaeota archaeon]MBD3199554.1 DEAD/DEAH box helicase [Candidatus Lokiarchaeota archaeon]
MQKTQDLHLTYIPSKYWNDSISKFSIKNKKTEIPTNASFFILWQIKANSSSSLEESIIRTFPNVPIENLISCRINLAVNNVDESNGYQFSIKKIKAKILPLLPASKLLNKLEIFQKRDADSYIYYSNSIQSWSLLTKLIFELLSRGNFVPLLEKETDKTYNGKWRLILRDSYDNNRFQKIIQNTPIYAHNIPADINNISKTKEEELFSNSLWHPTYLVSDYIDTIGDLLIRSILKKTKFRALEEFYNIERIKEKNREINISWDYKFLKSLLKDNNSFKIAQFHESIIPKLIKNWINITQISPLTHGITLTIRLYYPEEENDKWSLEIFIFAQNMEQLIPLGDLWKMDYTQSFGFLKSFKNKEEFIEIILRSLGTIRKIYPPLTKVLKSKYPKQLLLSSSEVMDFLGYPKELLIQSGFNVILPEVFKAGGAQRLTTKMVIQSKALDTKSTISSSKTPIFQMQDFINYKWEVNLGDKKLSEKEVNKLLTVDQPLVNWRGDWILLDKDDVEDIKSILSSSQGGKFSKPEGKINYMEAVQIGLAGKVEVEEQGPKYQVIIEGDFNDIVSRIKSFEKFEDIPTPEKFNGELRDYQKTGLTWMANMCALNFGVCLADDMGLGKTIQVIALIQYFREIFDEKSNSVLIVCPTSVLYNWKREINNFGPNLNVILHHGAERIKEVSEISSYLDSYDIVLTSYGTIRNDVDLLKLAPFRGIIIDESQNMKNYEAQQTQAIYQLQSQYRICLSGTPIENRLLELWTLFEFLNPGLLGSRKYFQENYIIPIERFQNKDAIKNLKRIISPFILRRVKTDKSVIQDLPEKHEMKIHFKLSEIQQTLYRELVNKTLNEFESNKSDKQGKSILVLSLLTKLKQICNHPYQYLHEKITDKKLTSEYESFISQSPKLSRLMEMLDEVIRRDEKAIIFTQFTQMGDILESVLKFKYDFTILYFHGGVPADKRKEIVSQFQSEDLNSPPILILSLKAGGTGLNLTNANSVFHYDSPWNPATQDQATDRAYRIGQTENVNVYKFITIGTIEEKIDTLLEEKRDLADTILASGESWISELSDDKLKDLISIDNENG